MPTPPVRGPFVIHGGARNVEASANWQILATRRDPYFNRAWNHFCSHQHAPDEKDSALLRRRFLTDKSSISRTRFLPRYRQLGQMLYRDLVKDALNILLPHPNLKVDLPSTARVALTEQAQQNRAVLHLLFAVPVKRGEVNRSD